MTEHNHRAVDLFREAYDDGAISEQSSSALLKIDGYDTQIDHVLGSASRRPETVLVSVLVDDSLSIGNITKRVHSVISGHNRLLRVARRRADATTSVLFHTRFFSRGPLSPYRDATNAADLSPESYRADARTTALYEQSVLMLGSVMAQARQLGRLGSKVRTFTLLLTDGEDNVGISTAQDVAFLVSDMLDFAENHIVAGMGIGERPMFQRVFRSMGIPMNWILTADSTESDIGETFARIENTLQLAAASESSFRQLKQLGAAS